MTIREHIGLRLHGLSLRICPQIATALEQALTPAIRQQTIAELAAAHHLRQAQALAQHQEHVAERAARQ